MRTATAADRVLKLARARRYAATGEGRRIRLAHRLSLPDVAAGTGAGVTTIWRWEHDRHRPQGDAAIRWVELLDALTGISSDEAAS
jgi:transcriptional regulator with XRE-family HTH domain